MTTQDWEAYFRALRAEKDAKDSTPELVAPGPEHTSRQEWPEGFAVPSVAASLVKLAEAAGWVTQTQYARGSVVCRRKGPDGTMARIVEKRHSVAVRLWHPGRELHAVAVWEAAVEAEKLSWKADLAKVWRRGGTPHEVGVAALKAEVKA